MFIIKINNGTFYENINKKTDEPTGNQTATKVVSATTNLEGTIRSFFKKNSNAKQR